MCWRVSRRWWSLWGDDGGGGRGQAPEASEGRPGQKLAVGMPSYRCGACESRGRLSPLGLSNDDDADRKALSLIQCNVRPCLMLVVP